MLQDLCEPRVVERVMSDEITLKQEGLLKHFGGPKSWCRSVGRGAGGTSHYVNDCCLSWAVCFNTQA